MGEKETGWKYQKSYDERVVDQEEITPMEKGEPVDPNNPNTGNFATIMNNVA